MAVQRVEVKNPVGMNYDLAPADLPPNVWSSVRNVSFVNGKSSKCQGYSSVFGTTPANVSYLLQSIQAGNVYWYEATPTKIFRTTGTVHTDLTKASGDYTSGRWNGTVLNDVIILNNSINNPQCLRVSDAKFLDLPNWPATAKASVVRSYKNYLIALDVTKSGTKYDTMVKWSAPADPGQVPSTWDETDPTNDAGEYSIAGIGGAIVDGSALRNSFIIYKEGSVHSMTYVGGVFVFSFRSLFEDVGILSQNCVAEFDGNHFVVGQGDVYVHNGVQKKSVIHDKMRNYLFSQIRSDAVASTFVVPDYQNNEMWVCFCSSDQNNMSITECDRALVWNWREDTWTIRDVPLLSYAAYGVVDPQVSDSWNSAVGSWDTDASPWGEKNYNPAKLKILMTSQTNDKIYSVGASSVADGAAFTSFLEKADISFGDDRTIKSVISVTPQVEGSGTMQFYIGTSPLQHGGYVTQGPYNFTIGQDYKIDFRAVGRYFKIRFSASSDASWKMNGYTFEVADTGGMR